MATHTRTRSGTLSGPHAVSLKVLRLSRPSLASQTPLPPTNFANNSSIDIPPSAGLASPNGDPKSGFPLTPLLTLPAAFGAAYVGETFTCTLCANNELSPDTATHRKSITSVKITAELQTPSKPDGHQLQLEKSSEGDLEDGNPLLPGNTLQRTLRYELKDEGPHVLAVTVTYTETLHTSTGEAATAGRARTFRKLYQFVSQQLLAVRSKITESKRETGVSARRWILEAQLENVGEASVVLERVGLREKEGIRSEDMQGEEGREAVVLKPQDVEQVMFVLEEVEKSDEGGGRVPLGQLDIDWRSAMGEKGNLTTGWLSSRGR
ncbi:Hypothetical predicted protein [Lecanosticta acicola]|uniref:Trafficking protein particle complex subunit 13 n=1 Tax=Lecanosticta acicola TaxID=111012 RepID=A0AAI8YZX1_9PEZI|nr:Hypothetical predicted protein [Lecanosticta acicola]